MSEQLPIRYSAGGDMEPGIYPFGPEQVVAMFGQSTARREQLGRILLQIVARLRASGIVRRCWLGGSFAGQKPAPRDINLWLLVSDGSEAVTTSVWFADIFEHERAKLVYGADIFWMTESGAATILDKVLDCLQSTRDGRVRGIVEIVL